MSKQDYDALARALNVASRGMLTEREKTLLHKVAYGVAEYCTSCNPQFNISRFYAACKLPEVSSQ